MIRLIQRRLIIPRGDTGSFTVPMLDNVSTTNTLAVLSIFNDNERIYQKEQLVSGNTIKFEFSHDDTMRLPVGSYYWDVKIYVNPQYNEDNLLINGDEIHSYYAAFKLPECEIVPYSLNKERVIK